MATYFSNHSQPRTTVTSTNQPAPTTTSTNTQSANRSRLSSSKHFSTSVASANATERTRPNDNISAVMGDITNGVTTAHPHPLKNTWVFWFRQQRVPGNKIISYEEGIKKISAFSSVESFWSLWTHLAPPSALLPTTDYLLFHAGIRRPVWEDPLNISGGKWIIRLKKGVADRLWEDLVLAIIGDQFDDCRPADSSENGIGAVAKSWEDASDGGSEWPEICGCTISVRQSEDIVSLWNRTEAEPKLREKIRETIRRALNLPLTTIMEYKSNNDSMQDKSSFRTTPVDRTPIS